MNVQKMTSFDEAKTAKGKVAVQTNLSRTIETSGASAQYDENIKQLLADKQILAWILKYTVREFSEMELDDIIKGIGKKVEIGAASLDPTGSKLGKITGDNTEDNVAGEGKIVYDIKFSVQFAEEAVGFLINIEAQRSTRPSKLKYHLENRIVYYLSRMISAQKNTEFFNSDYDRLKRVRSIWICMDGDDGANDSIEEISLRKDTVFGGEAFSEIDLVRAIIVHIRRKKRAQESKNKLIAMLEDLLSEMSVEEKKTALKKHGMSMSVELKERANSMCNLSEMVYEDGREKTTIEFILSGDISMERGAEKLGVSVEEMKKKVEAAELEGEQYV